MSKTIVTDTLAKAVAVKCSLVTKKGDDPSEVYDTLMGHRDGDEAPVVNVLIGEPPETIDDLQAKVEAIADASKEQMVIFAAAVKNGLVLAAVDATLPGNANEWEIERFATVGANISSQFRIRDELFTFDTERRVWAGSGGTIAPYDPFNGLPIHPLVGK